MENCKTTLLNKEVILSYRDVTQGIDEQDLIQAVSDIIAQKLESKNEVIFFDIGANYGHFSLLASNFNGNVRGCAFEPNPIVFEVLNENIHLNNLNEKIIAYNIGVSNSMGFFDLKVPKNFYYHGLATFAENPSERFKINNNDDGEYLNCSVMCKPLDSIFLQLNYECIDVIKIDTEGSELNIIKGAEGVLKKYKPTIIMEYQNINANMFGYDRNECVELLTSYGYTNFELLRDSDIKIY